MTEQAATSELEAKMLPEDVGMEEVTERNLAVENNVIEVEVKEQGEEGKNHGDVKIGDAENGTREEANIVNILEVKDGKVVEAEAKVATDNVKVSEVDNPVLDEAEVTNTMVGEDLKYVQEAKVDEEDEKVRIKSGAKIGEYMEIKELNKTLKQGEKDDEETELKGNNECGVKSEDVPKTPANSSIERPVRERRTVERLVEALEKEPTKAFLIEKGHGTPLKEIPNVAYKLAKKKPADLKLLYHVLFRRQGKVADFKNHILQFSGFVWHDDEEKQKTKVKEKLDKCTKDTLTGLCDLFNLPVTKATTRKEELVATLLDFMEAPHATDSVILSDKEQQTLKNKKRKRVTGVRAPKSSGSIHMQHSKKKNKAEETPERNLSSSHETSDAEEEDDENGLNDEDEMHSESKERNLQSEEEDEEEPKEGKSSKHKFSRGASAGRTKPHLGTSPIKMHLPINKCATKTSSSKHFKAMENNDASVRFSKKKRTVNGTEDKAKADSKEKFNGKLVAKGTENSRSMETGPSKEEVRNAICNILDKVNFNTATFSDVLHELDRHFGMDLSSRKAAIKFMIEEELTRLADEAEQNEKDEEDEEDEEEAGKDEHPEPMGKEVNA
ncbi:DEK domain-containing chromatin-associated protein 1-like isoform X2 [Typha latifolia]|uniref:DEK domain-containing chromatin-associated protein 1-like isoform X2 n=1 Tax=Typha latifolia TaxID=4733 RepID=UPI003C2B8104